MRQPFLPNNTVCAVWRDAALSSLLPVFFAQAFSSKHLRQPLLINGSVNGEDSISQCALPLLPLPTFQILKHRLCRLRLNSMGARVYMSRPANRGLPPSVRPRPYEMCVSASCLNNTLGRTGASRLPRAGK
ncbi:hypothetical protein EJ05DRAFT_309918 [Pseudovirgaria hyperparasitica]|uniref:Uncharacterized protein n=1 Tax=Pseudovirgaria hyperparasitica TaxID=470096 RepID=A0A6A6WE07_9PEZI|nr:uncharacterized protein EJ05DRAFT_309918 [Pseudovirgaria hyperparasitica]KAF2759797.1 hypothetical protein EJ05DRAFT_309918 [Pseudovirgaria hyperparasitica]